MAVITICSDFGAPKIQSDGFHCFPIYLPWSDGTRWVWVNSGSWWWTRRPGVLWFMGSQRVGYDCVAELNWWGCDLLITLLNTPVWLVTTGSIPNPSPKYCHFSYFQVVLCWPWVVSLHRCTKHYPAELKLGPLPISGVLCEALYSLSYEC